jgi:hypothetical protein
MDPVNGTWKAPMQYRLNASNTWGRLLIPVRGSTLGNTVTFNWSAGTGVTAYGLDVGTVAGFGDIYGQNVGTALTRTVSGIPQNGKVYMQLWSLIGGIWYPNRYSFR